MLDLVEPSAIERQGTLGSEGKDECLFIFRKRSLLSKRQSERPDDPFPDP
jgi:hypothetical protein